MSKVRDIVTPGTKIADGDKRPGDHAYRDDGAIYADAVGVVMERGDRVEVIPLSGPYLPKRGDLVIAEVVELTQTVWYCDIGTYQDAPLHVREVPWDVDFGATDEYLNVGDTVLAEVTRIDEFLRPYIGMENRQCRKLDEGLIIDVDATKVARLIGSKGSMVKLLKSLTGAKMFVAQNGRVWVKGTTDQVQAAEAAVQLIEREAHTTGLTERVESFLKARQERLGTSGPPEAADEGSEEAS